MFFLEDFGQPRVLTPAQQSDIHSTGENHSVGNGVRIVFADCPLQNGAQLPGISMQMAARPWYKHNVSTALNMRQGESCSDTECESNASLILILVENRQTLP